MESLSLLTLTIQFLAVHSVTNQSCFLPLFARVHHLAKAVLYTSLELFKRVPFGVIGLVRYKHAAVRQLLFLYAYFYFGCRTCYVLHTQWLVFKTLLLCGDVEINPGPETLDFCTWNLNSITAYDFLRVSLMEAYNSVYNYDLIGIVETHLDSTVDEEKLALNGYTFIKNNHPQNVKRGGVGLYIKDSLPSKNRSDLVTLPECIVYEIHLNRKKYFYSVIYSATYRLVSALRPQLEFEMMLRNL